jgi:hypothetical protein
MKAKPVPSARRLGFAVLVALLGSQAASFAADSSATQPTPTPKAVQPGKDASSKNGDKESASGKGVMIASRLRQAKEPGLRHFDNVQIHTAQDIQRSGAATLSQYLGRTRSGRR